MIVQTEKKRVPALRFPEFEGAWEEKRLGDISEMTSSKRVYLADYTKNGIPFYRGKEISEIKNNQTPSDILYISEKKYEDFKEKYGVPTINDILITAVGTLGNVLRVKNDEKFYFKDGNLIWLRKISECAEFLEILIEWNRKKLLRTSIGSTQKALTMVELRKIKLRLPPLPEQQKIADFLTSIDTRIQQLTRKVTLLEQYKKGVMQQIFSQAIRFKDDQGRDFPDWEEKRLKDLLDYEQPTKYLVSNTEYDDAYSIPVLTAGKTFILGYTNEEDGVFKAKLPTIIFDDFTTAFKFVDFPFKAKSSAMKMLIPKSERVNIKFVFESMGTVNFPLGEHKRYWISEFQYMKIPYPTLPEQQKIADFLSAIDRKITHTKDQLEYMRSFKKGLLQQLFV